jgi:hypothetical protein
MHLKDLNNVGDRRFLPTTQQLDRKAQQNKTDGTSRSRLEEDCRATIERVSFLKRIKGFGRIS